MNNLLSLLFLVISTYLLVRLTKVDKIIDFTLSFFFTSFTVIVVFGYILSLFDQLGQINAWRNAGLLSSLVILAVYITKKENPFQPIDFKLRDVLRQKIKEVHHLPIYDKILVLATFILTLLISTGIFIIILTTAPREWDSLTYHLPRMAHYLQAGNLDYFDANYWAQVVHPKNSTLLLLYTFLVTGRNENLLQVIQFISYWMVNISVYGVARKIGLSSTQGLFSACISALLITNITQANTTQNDLIISAFLGGSVYFLFAFRESRSRVHLFLAALGVTLSAGTKATFALFMPSLTLLAFFLTYEKHWQKWAKNMAVFTVFGIVLSFAVVLPSGYLENYKIFGNPFGNQDVSDIHTFTEDPLNMVFRGGTYNLLRYGVNFISLEGLPPVEFVIAAQNALQYLPKTILDSLGVDLASREATGFSWFEYGSPPGGAYWGVLGFGLVWVTAISSVLRLIKNTDFFFLSSATILFYIFISFSFYYTSDKGRFFSMCTALAVPLTGILLGTKTTWVRIYIAAIILLGSISAVSATFAKLLPYSSHYPEYLSKNNVYEMNRLEQITFSNQKYYKTFASFDHIVPADATVAVFFYPNMFEYPLYGPYLTRKIIPINSFHRGLQPIPEEAEYLLYAKGYPCALPNDRQLGDKSSIFLRVLNEENRACIENAYP